MASSTQPGVVIASNNLGPGVNLTSWICLVIMCLVVLSKVLSKLVRNHKIVTIRSLQSDDYFIIVAMLAAVGQSIAVSAQVSAGLGQHESTLTSSQIEYYQKSGYASQFFYVTALCMGKFTTLSFTVTFAQNTKHRSLVHGLMGFTALWLIIAVFGIAFQCRLPQAWTILSSQCFEQHAFWTAIGVLDLIVDVALIGTPVYVLWKVQTSWAKKSVIFVAFAARAIYMPLIILRLIYITGFYSSSDRTYSEFEVAVVTQVGMNVSVMLACVPFLKPLLDNLQPGWSTSDVRTGIGYNSMADSNIRKDYAMGSVVKFNKHPTSPQISDSRSQVAESQTQRFQTATAVAAGVQSEPSFGRPERMVIKHTTDFVVQSEGCQLSSPDPIH